MKNQLKRTLSLFLTVVLLFTTTACSSQPSNPGLADPNEKVIVENIETEHIDTEAILTEFITREIYLEEFVVAEDKITELLLEEEMINEVLLCKTIYVPEGNIDDFSKHSQTAQLFGDRVEIGSVLRKVAIGTGVIITIAVVKKAGLSKQIASIVVAAADKSLKFAKTGAVVGTVFGAFTGAADEIDGDGRISAVAGFALATVGLIVTTVSLVGAIPSGGTSGFGVAEGIHLGWAGVKFLGAATGTVLAAKDTIKAFSSTDVSEIEWDNVDWEKVGVSAVQKAIQNGADGYMWGTIYGAIDGTIEEYYLKYCTPYTRYQDRLKKVPQNGERGQWTGTRGESYFVLDKPIVLPDGTQITQIYYQNAVPDFSPYALAEVSIPNMTEERYIKGGNFDQADAALAEYWSQIKYKGQSRWTSDDVKQFRENYPYKLTWHEMSNTVNMQLVPFDVNDTFGHYGGVAECKARIGNTEEGDYD